jgi:D-alanyl-D-alanine dipeptidase
VAQRLLTAAQSAYDAGYRLKIYDAYRPNRTTVLLYNKAEALLDEPVPGRVRDPNSDDPEELLTYGNFLTDNGKYPLNYFLAQGGSLHNLGIAVDLTIESRGDQVEQKMQSGMHDLTHFSVIYRNNQNAVLLKGFMESAGFGGLVSEWWHFQDNDIRQTVKLASLWGGVSPEGWKLSDGGWRYRLADGTYVCAQALTIGETEYTFDEWGYVN